jgi:hypothetical protein
MIRLAIQLKIFAGGGVYFAVLGPPAASRDEIMFTFIDTTFALHAEIPQDGRSKCCGGTWCLAALMFRV